MAEYTDLARKYAPWSYSKARMAMECPFKFDLKYVQKKKEIEEQKSAALLVGSAVHRVLEFVVKGVPPDDALEITLNEMVLASDEEDEVRACMDQINNFRTRIGKFQKKHGVTKDVLFTEKKIGVTEDFLPAKFFGRDVFFRGVWDLAMLSNSGYLVVIDHKRRGFPKLEYYEKQLQIYAVTARALYPTIRGVKAGIHFVESEDILWAETYTADFIDHELKPSFIGWINNAAEEVVTGDICVGSYCKWCTYKDTICMPERKVRRKAGAGIRRS